MASLEFVLILPILLFVLFAGAELSRAWFTLNLLTTAAREAARSGVVATPDAVQSAATAKLNQDARSGELVRDGLVASLEAFSRANCRLGAPVGVVRLVASHSFLIGLSIPE